MNISIIGGGPAGLYFACSMKILNPGCSVTIFEAKNESVNSFGLGYTLQSLNTALMSRLDENFFQKLFPFQRTPPITKALFKTNNDSRVLNFKDGFSVTRKELILFFQNKAQSLGINIIEKKITPSQLKRLKNTSDLLVGADGINSVVRQHFSSKLLPNSYTAKLKFSWFVNETSQIRNEACFYAFQAKEGVIIMTSYPLTKNKQVVILEMTNSCASSGHFKDKSPADSIPYLNEILSSNGDEISLESTGLPWYSYKMNTTKNLFYDNVTLVGDSAFSFHYSAGQGLASAFTMGFTLANCLQKSNDVTVGLKHYERAQKSMFKKPSEQSTEHIKWFENIDSHFKNTPEEDWLDHFIMKEKFQANDPLFFSNRVKSSNSNLASL